MKKLCFLFLAVFSLSVSAQTGNQPQPTKPYRATDIIIVTKLNKDWSTVLVDRIRRLLRNFQILDPFKYSYDGSLVLTDTTAGTFLPQSSQAIVRDFGNVLGLDIFNAKTKVTLKGFDYEVKGFKTDLKAIDNKAENFTAKIDFSASEIFVEAGKISLDVEIPSQDGRSLPVITIDLVKPVLRATNENLVKIVTQIQILEEEKLGFKIDKLNLDDMARNLNTSNVELDYERVDIPKISVRIGNKLINFSPEKIQNYLRRNHEGIKGFILAQTARALKSGVSDAYLALAEKVKIDRKYWLPTPFIRSMINIRNIRGFSSSNDFVVDLLGDFCTLPAYEADKDDCVNKKITQTAPSRLTRELREESLRMIRETMARGEADMMASVSEDYLNKLIAGTIDAGLWKDGLDKAGIKLGPNKVMLRLNKEGETGMLVLDGIYKMKKLEAIATGVKEIRFPLVLNVGIRFEKDDKEIPTLIIRSHSVDTSDDILIKGIPELGVESSIRNVTRFRGKVLNTIRSAVAEFNGKDILPMPIVELSGLSLEEANFVSNGKGRMNGTLKLQDVLDAN